MKEHRYFSRINFTVAAKLQFDSQLYETELLDLSLKGALIQTQADVPLKKGDIAELKFDLNAPDISMSFNAELVHLHKNNLGFKFNSLDITTLTHLRRLLELNTGNSEQITNELSFWLQE